MQLVVDTHVNLCTECDVAVICIIMIMTSDMKVHIFLYFGNDDGTINWSVFNWAVGYCNVRGNQGGASLTNRTSVEHEKHDCCFADHPM